MTFQVEPIIQWELKHERLMNQVSRQPAARRSRSCIPNFSLGHHSPITFSNCKEQGKRPKKLSISGTLFPLFSILLFCSKVALNTMVSKHGYVVMFLFPYRVEVPRTFILTITIILGNKSLKSSKKPNNYFFSIIYHS
jgi:hypothetical protein